MKIGTKSLLFGAHAFWLHGWCVAAAWWKLYGFPVDPRLWFAFFLHDIGYWGCPNMDGPEGKEHPRLGAKILHNLFDPEHCGVEDCVLCERECHVWERFTLYHSRSMAKIDGQSFSRLCVADKLATAFTPSWLYLPMVTLTGEIDEYLAESQKHARGSKNINADELEGMVSGDKKRWFKGFQSYVERWAYKHKDEVVDTLGWSW